MRSEGVDKTASSSTIICFIVILCRFNETQHIELGHWILFFDPLRCFDIVIYTFFMKDTSYVVKYYWFPIDSISTFRIIL